MSSSGPLFLEITSGGLKGTRASLREGFSIGRKKGTLNVRDSKLSSLHVITEQRPDGSLWLVDAGSSNGIKLKNGRVHELKLETGVEFILGRTEFRVLNSAQAGETGIAELPVEPTVTRDWWHWVQALAERGQVTSRAKKRPVQPIHPAIRLKIIRGPQTGTEWVIGYGPRIVGSAAIDLTLDDVTLPGICFKILPEKDGILFQNETEKEVKLNGQWVKSVHLKSGDTIEVKGTQIQVKFDGEL